MASGAMPSWRPSAGRQDRRRGLPGAGEIAGEPHRVARQLARQHGEDRRRPCSRNRDRSGRRCGRHRERAHGGSTTSASGLLDNGSYSIVTTILPMALRAAEPGDGLAGLGQRKALGHHRLDGALGVERHQLGDVGGVGLSDRGAEGAPEHADHLAGLEQRQVERQLGDAGREADHQEAALPGDGAQRGLRIVAADGIVDDVGAVLAAGLLEEVGQRLGAGLVEGAGRIDDAVVGAVLPGERQLLLATTRRRSRARRRPCRARAPRRRRRRRHPARAASRRASGAPRSFSA